MRRLCEAPVSLRYVQRYRCEAIQCRERNIRLTYRRIVRQPWIASPHIICTYRKCGGGFAKTGWACPALSRRNAPGRWTWVAPRTARETTPPLRGTPPKRGIYGGVLPAIRQSRNLRPTPFPSWEGCRPQAAGWCPPQGATPQPTCAPPIPSVEGWLRRAGVVSPPQRTQPSSKPTSLISDIC
ncbi:MAG: hypothetical protein LBM98_07925 [Oscillospiraceae bacterium]|nr:hypothetical protein [Oscillospiraceae bacterium]